MAPKAPSSNPNQDLIDQLIAQGYSDEEIMQAMQSAGGTGTGDASALASGGGLGADFLTQQLQDQKDQNDIQNLLALLEYFGGEDKGAQELAIANQGKFQLPQGAQLNIPFADGSDNPYVNQQNRWNQMQALNMDEILRKRNRGDAEYLAAHQPSVGAVAPNPQRQTLVDAILAKLMPKPAEAAPPTETPGQAMAAAAGSAAPPVNQGYNGTGGFSQMGDAAMATPGEVNYATELRKKLAGQQQGGGGFNPSSTILDLLKANYGPANQASQLLRRVF